MSRTNRSFPALLIFQVFLMIACNGNKKTTENEGVREVLPEDIVELRDDQIKQADIVTGRIEMRALSTKIVVSGLVAVAPHNLASVCTPMGGFIEQISLMPGQAVKKGQSLAIIANQDFVEMQQNYLEARSRFEFAEAEYKRHGELYQNDVYSEQNLQQVTAEYKSLKAQVKALEQKLVLVGINPARLDEDGISSTVSVESPITGYVRTVNVNLGKYVSSADVMFEIINSDRLLLELSLFDKDIDKVAAGQRIRFFINNETEQHEAIISQTGKSISNDKTYKVYANITENCKNVLPGMYVNALIDAPNNKVTALPSEAVVSFDDRNYIFVFEKNKEEAGRSFVEYRMVEVQKGITDDGYTAVVLPETLNIESAEVVIQGAYNLLSAKKNAGEMAC